MCGVVSAIKTLLMTIDFCYFHAIVIAPSHRISYKKKKKRPQIDLTEKVQRINWIRSSEFKSMHIHERDKKARKKTFE